MIPSASGAVGPAQARFRSSFSPRTAENSWWVNPEGGWADHDGATLEGHQFFCHAACFKKSVPESPQYGLRLALDNVD